MLLSPLTRHFTRLNAEAACSMPQSAEWQCHPPALLTGTELQPDRSSWISVASELALAGAHQRLHLQNRCHGQQVLPG